MENNKVKSLIIGILVIVFLGMIIFGQRTVGLAYLGLELIGLTGLLTLLFLYNKKFK